MAGIGFELRKLLKDNSLSGILQAYVYASVIASGPWVLSILGILVIGILSSAVSGAGLLVTQFQVSVTYLIAGSLILTGFVQLSFTRFIADRLYEEREAIVLPNFNGVTLLVTAISGVLGLSAVAFLFPEQNLIYRLLMLTGFVLLSNIWVATIFLSGLKQYKQIVFLYALGYGVTVVASLLLQPLGLEGLLLGFVLGHGVMLLGMVVLIVRSFPAPTFMAFDFARPGAMFGSLMLVGFLYNFGVWIDKILFWFWPTTGQPVIGPLHASVIYDLPIFLAYLSILPGMAVFLVRMETDFVEYYQKFYGAVRGGSTLARLEDLRKYDSNCT